MYIGRTQFPLSLSSSVVLQEQFLRSVLFHNHYSFLSASGYEIDEDGQSQSQKEQQELLMKMFAVSMKTNARWFRGVPVASDMFRLTSRCFPSVVL